MKNIQNIQHMKRQINNKHCRLLISFVININQRTYYEVPNSHFLKSHRHIITQPLFKIGTYLSLQLISIMFQMHLQSVTDQRNHCQLNATIMDLLQAPFFRHLCW